MTSVTSRLYLTVRNAVIDNPSTTATISTWFPGSIMTKIGYGKLENYKIN